MPAGADGGGEPAERFSGPTADGDGARARFPTFEQGGSVGTGRVLGKDLMGQVFKNDWASSYPRGLTNDFGWSGAFDGEFGECLM